MRVSSSQEVDSMFKSQPLSFPPDPSCIGVDSVCLTLVGKNHAVSSVKHVRITPRVM